MENKKEYVESQTAVLAPLGQVLIRLSDENTQALLSFASDVLRSPESQAQAAVILKRLHALNAEIAPQFHPKQEAISGLPLRMILGTPTVELTSAPSIPSFLVVSYCWHYPGWPLADAATPIAPGWEVSRPMVDAVMGLRQSADEGVWLDRLCINQSSDTDKMSHIGAMDVVYRSARRMVILLEDVQLTPAEEAAGLAYAGFYADMSAGTVGMEGAARIKFIDEYFPSREKAYRDAGRADVLMGAHAFAMKMLGARWFSRAWCGHESRISRHGKVNNPMLLCFGHDGRVLSFEFRSIFYIAMYLSDQESVFDPTGNQSTLHEAMSDPKPRTLRQRWWRTEMLLPSSGDEVSTMQHLDVKDVMWIFSLLVIASGDLVPLALTGPRLKIPDGAGKETLSWVSGSMMGIIDYKMPATAPDSITAVTKDYVELDLIVFAAQPRPASPASLDVASRIVEEHELDMLARDFIAAADETIQSRFRVAAINSSGGSRPDAPLNGFVKAWLALAIDCGLQWILRFPDVMASGTASWDDGILGKDADARLTAAATSLLAHFDTPETKQDSDGATLHNAIRFMTCAVDPRICLLHTGPRRLPIGPFADGAEDFAITSPISDHSYIVVPAAIAHLPDWHHRAWVVEPFDPAAPPEDPATHLPRAPSEEESGKKPGELLAVEVYPILWADGSDRREKRDDARATWRLRKLNIFYRCQKLVKEADDVREEGDDKEVGEGKKKKRMVLVSNEVSDDDNKDDGPAAVLLKKQRVYGADDYDWRSITAAGIKWEEDSGLRPKPGGTAEGQVEAQAEGEN
ncbi:uncharacterized protein DNG_04181 [Cephalotrichum gorgonifer]|uniref:Heterokaryon incompatibility domain-containing protein n=1 Tax=Cephalotrichum gorgonifer TaxID=2041049 RepID=A0AAE8MXM0_9PEZI|nr:uncharacterized protein DNG_04181 [Cephalotrichum gorgonifer]